MADTVYKKTALPVKLNLNDRNTREQLKTGPAEDSGRGTLEGVGSKSSASQSKKGCTDVMQKDLQKWLVAKGIIGPPPSPEAEQRAMWQWIRDFHKEYNDDWFTRNMPRLRDQFRPTFTEEMKRMRTAQQGSSGSGVVGGADLLDFERPALAVPAALPASGGDLLSLDAAPTLAASQGAPPQTGGLLDFDFGSGAPQVSDLQQPSLPYLQPQQQHQMESLFTVQPGLPSAPLLHDEVGILGLAAAPSQAPVPPSEAARKGSDLLDLM